MNEATDKIVIAKNVVKRYSENKGVGPVSMSLKTNNIYSVIGPNASGKTTLLKCLSKAEDLDSGEINYFPTEVNSNNHLLYSLVFQQPEPWPHLNVLQNVMLPLKKVLNLNDSEAKQRAEIELERFGISDRCKSFSHQLSGGLKQRVVQARAFAMQPTFLYLDEPTSALDPEWTDYFGKIILEYAHTDRMVLIISHQMNFLKKTSDKVFFLQNGIILEEGSPDQIFNYPQNDSLIRFIENS